MMLLIDLFFVLDHYLKLTDFIFELNHYMDFISGSSAQIETEKLGGRGGFGGRALGEWK